MPQHRIRLPRRDQAIVGAAACLLLPLTFACGSDSKSATPDAGAGEPDAGELVDLSDELFQDDHVLEISITLADADWTVLRNQPDVLGMPKITCGDQPAEKPYDYFPGDITIDGVTVENVGVRKKGGFGSISSERPGFKIKPNEYTPGKRISGLKRLTLNNNHQDPTLISQCLGYRLFRAAGLPASRCSFAHVTVNGEDLGIYSNVESINDDFLARNFADDTGNLYESGGDFTTGGTDSFQPKVNRDNPDCSDLAPVVSALQTSDSEFPTAMDAVVDVDAFTTYWAMEVLTDHWDGYANNANNFFMYHDPTSGKFHFLPWGIDALFTGRTRTTRPDAVFACGSLPWRLYDVPETRDVYLVRLRELLDTVWDEAALLSEIDRMEALLTPYVDPLGTGSLTEEIDRTRAFVGSRRATLLAELDAGTPFWPYPAGQESCRINIGTLSGTFDTTWGTLDDFAAGSGTLSGTLAGVPLSPTTAFSSAGDSEGKANVRLISQQDDGTLAVLYIIVNDPANFVVGTRPIDLVGVAAFMTYYDPVTDTAYGGGLLLGGTLTLTAAGTTADAPVTGSITSDVLEL